MRSNRPDVSVVVASHERPLRLRWLMNALEEQTLAPHLWELVIVHDSRGPATDELLRSHPIGNRVSLRHSRLEPHTGLPGRQRNVGWRAARAPLVAFTDDDCRPERDWLAQLLETARAHPGAIVQGRVEPDPFETDLLRAPHARTIEVPHPPGPYAQTCNVLYPRELLERIGGFVEFLAAGEDTDLCERARAAGAGYVGAPPAVVYHAVESSSLPRAVLRTRRWADLAYVVKHHPRVRQRHGLFWRREHASLLLALGATASGRHVLAAVCALQYARRQLARRGSHPRGRLRAAAELPGRVVIDVAEIGTLAIGSARHRTLFL